ncbi:MAG: hypothetical protein OHK0046_20350 [Anaerolineae bacterium]
MTSSLRTYLLVALFFAVLFYLISLLFGPDLVVWGERQQIEAAIRGQRFIELVVFEPFVFVFGVNPWGPVVAGLAWPLIFIWLALILISLAIIAGVDVSSSLDL